MSQSVDPSVTQPKGLTAAAIDALPKGGRLVDDRVAGLEVRRTATGTSFLLYYRTRHGVQRRPKIGAYPTLNIAQARDIAKAMLVAVAAGRDPSQEEADARTEPDMQAVWTRCEQEHWNKDTKWDGEAKSIYTRHIAPKLGRAKVRAIEYADIQGLHAAMRKTPNAANRMLAVAAKMMTLAERWGWRPVGSNPCRLIARYPERKRRRYAGMDEIRAIGLAMDKYAEMPEHLTGVAFLLLLLFSGARPTEIGRGTPDMLEAVGEAGVLRIEKGKTGERAVFLPVQAMRIIARLPKDRESLAGRVTVPRALWKLIKKDTGCKDLWARDLRRTFATVALTGGVPIGVVGELLGHRSAQTTKVYAKLMEGGAHEAAAGIAGRMEALLTATAPSPE